MSVTIGLVANVYNESNALPGWLEAHLPFFDDVRVLHAGPGGEYSTDGTIDILEKWGVPTEFCSIDDGFGVVRTRAARMCPCDYVMVLDADERFFHAVTELSCSGTPTPHGEVDRILQNYHFRDGHRPDWAELRQLGADLKVTRGILLSQGTILHNALLSRPDAVVTVRRHWHDLTMLHPTQNWNTEPDWQTRILRKTDSIYYDTSTRMHERVCGINKVVCADVVTGPFFDHFHFFFKRMEEDQRAHDIQVYDAIHAGRPAPTLASILSATSPE